MIRRMAMKLHDTTAVPTGVRVMSLATHPDNRGDLTEVFRMEWIDSPPPIQWMVVRSEANALRGVHVHARHWDYYCVVSGELAVGLHDLRPGAAMARSTAMLLLSGQRLQLLTVPSGVAHGLYSPNPSTLLVGTSTYYDPADDRGCRWDARELGLEWPCTSPILSAKDRDAGSYAELEAGLRADLGLSSAPV